MKLTILLKDYSPFADISASNVIDEVSILVTIPKICLKLLCKEYNVVRVAKLELNFSNFSNVNPTSALDNTLLFEVSFISAGDKIYYQSIVNSNIYLISYDNGCFNN